MSGTDPLESADQEQGEERGHAPELAEEVGLGGTPGAEAANAALRALSRAARSFLIYEPHNEAIRTFLQLYRDSFVKALAFGPLQLDIRPFEMVRAGEVVYLERDRGRSLAFRMFRDGVRKLTFEEEVPWEELLKLLEILSIRYTGVRQQEDDIVTLLWKAGFTKIAIGAVEGFVPDEEEAGGLPGMEDIGGAEARAEGAQPEGAERAERAERAEQPERAERYDQSADQRGMDGGVSVEVPTDWDRPIPALLTARPIKFIPIPLHYLQQLQQEATGSLPQNCIRLVRRMVQAAMDPTDPTGVGDVLPLVEEIRDFLLADGQLSWLMQLLPVVEQLPEEERALVLGGFAGEGAIRKVLHSVQKGAEEAPPDLVALLDRLPGDHISHLIHLLATEKGETQRRVARRLVGRFLPKRPAAVLEAIRRAGPGIDTGQARELLRICVEAAPEQQVEAALELLHNEDGSLRLELLKVLEGAPQTAQVSEALRLLFAQSGDEFRLRVIGVIAARQERLLFPTLLARVEKAGMAGIPEREAEAIGVALARLDAARAREIFERWVKPQGLFSRLGVVPGQRTQQWAAVSGLAAMPGDCEPLLKGLLDRVDADLRAHCVMLMVRRRRGAHG